jgi:hypothetical protein
MSKYSWPLYIVLFILIIWVIGILTGMMIRKDEMKAWRNQAEKHYHEIEMLRTVISHYEPAPIRQAKKLNR